MKIHLVLLITILSLSNLGFSQTHIESVPRFCEYLSSDSIIPGIGNRIKLKLTIPVDSLEKYSEVHISIGTTENRSDIFYQSYPLTKGYMLKDELFNMSNSQISINIGEFDPDIKEKHINVKLIRKEIIDSPFFKKDTIQ